MKEVKQSSLLNISIILLAVSIPLSYLTGYLSDLNAGMWLCYAMVLVALALTGGVKRKSKGVTYSNAKLAQKFAVICLFICTWLFMRGHVWSGGQQKEFAFEVRFAQKGYYFTLCKTTDDIDELIIENKDISLDRGITFQFLPPTNSGFTFTVQKSWPDSHKYEFEESFKGEECIGGSKGEALWLQETKREKSLAQKYKHL